MILIQLTQNLDFDSMKHEGEHIFQHDNFIIEMGGQIVSLKVVPPHKHVSFDANSDSNLQNMQIVHNL
jgi:hypothetical protein